MPSATAADMKEKEREILKRTRAEFQAEYKKFREDGLRTAEHKAHIEDQWGDGPVDKIINEIYAIEDMRDDLDYRKGALELGTDAEEDLSYVLDVQDIYGQKRVALHVRDGFKIAEQAEEIALLKKELNATKKAMKAQLAETTMGMSQLHVGRTRRCPLVKNATEAEDEIMRDVYEANMGKTKLTA